MGEQIDDFDEEEDGEEEAEDEKKSMTVNPNEI